MWGCGIIEPMNPRVRGTTYVVAAALAIVGVALAASLIFQPSPDRLWEQWCTAAGGEVTSRQSTYVYEQTPLRATQYTRHYCMGPDNEILGTRY